VIVVVCVMLRDGVLPMLHYTFVRCVFDVCAGVFHTVVRWPFLCLDLIVVESLEVESPG
jgi:hypothetical protein